MICKSLRELFRLTDWPVHLVIPFLIVLFFFWESADTLAAQEEQDHDLDGVPDVADNCPYRANPPEGNGEQPAVCGSELRSALKHFVFLESRTFRLPDGLDQRLLRDQQRERPRRFFLHIEPDDEPLVLTADQRGELRKLGIELGPYIPGYTFIARVSADRDHLQQLVDLPFVRGVSVIEPMDRVARNVRRARGGQLERTEDGRLALSLVLYDDVREPAVDRLFRHLGVEETAADAEERAVLVDDFSTVRALARSGLVAWIDEPFEAPQPFGGVSRGETRTDVVEDVHGFLGTDLNLAMFENNPLPLPANGLHPDIDGRVIRENCNGFAALCPPEELDHNLAVAGIMIGDGTLDAAVRGLLPEANLATFGNAFGQTNRHIWYRYPRQARRKHDAAMVNYSTGSRLNCNRIGDYRTDAKQLDKAVSREGISVVRAAGNTRGPDGDLALERSDKDRQAGIIPPRHGPCETNLRSIANPVAKNDIAVGSWYSVDDDIAETSAAGPTADDRLKPDIVAPGINITTTSVDEDSGVAEYRLFGGTSAAAPVASGVLGLIYQALRDGQNPRDPIDVPAASAKAILLHTARDVGPWGPDYFTGWGLIDAAAAVRVALEHGTYLHEDTLTLLQPTATHSFDVSGTVYGFKATLVWDDPHASAGSSHALINNLDLEVTDPTGAQSYYPLDTLLDPANAEQEALEGAEYCTSTTCADDRNPVEQVIVRDPAGGPLPSGTWTATVTGNPLADPDQPFSLVITPDECPVRVFADTTLTGPITCPYDPLEPVAISIEADDVELQCAGHAITGEGAAIDGFAGVYAGIRTLRDRVSLQGCEITDFDVGIDFAENRDGVVRNSNIENTGSAGIRMSGTAHTVDNTTVFNAAAPDASGILIIGEAPVVRGSTVTPNPAALGTSGIHVVATGIGQGRIEDNRITGAQTGMLVDVIAEDPDGEVEGYVPVESYVIARNHIGPVTGDGMAVSGPLANSFITENEIEGFGLEHAAIRMTAKAAMGGAPKDNEISANRIFGASVDAQIGIALEGMLYDDEDDPTEWQEAYAASNRVFGHLTIENVGIGIAETRGENNELYGNVLPASVVGIISLTSRGGAQGRHIEGNIINGAPVGIEIQGDDLGISDSSALIHDNTISQAVWGAWVNMVSEGSVAITSNSIRTRAAGTGLLIENSVNVSANDNIFAEDPAHTQDAIGISAVNATALNLSRNTVLDYSTGIGVLASQDVDISSNTVTESDDVGIAIASGDVIVEGNSLNDLEGIGIRVISGNGVEIVDNTMQPVTTGDHGIVTGEIDNQQDGGIVIDLVIQDQEISDFENAVSIGRGTVSFEITESSFEASERAINAEDGNDIDPAQVEITDSEFDGIDKDAFFLKPIDTSGNSWSEVPGMNIIDADGDGKGDCGQDWKFSSTDYTGAQPDVALTSTKTNQVSDDQPQTNQQGVC